MKNLLIFLLCLLSLSSCIDENEYNKEVVKIPVIEKHRFTKQISVLPPEDYWMAKLANGDSITFRTVPPDTVIYIYYTKK